METTETYSSNNRYWWLMLIIGILSILCGIWVFRNPVESYFAQARLPNNINPMTKSSIPTAKPQPQFR